MPQKTSCLGQPLTEEKVETHEEVLNQDIVHTGKGYNHKIDISEENKIVFQYRRTLSFQIQIEKCEIPYRCFPSPQMVT